MLVAAVTGVYLTIANIWFLLSALSNDVLYIRFYLLSAYVFLFAGGWTNFPPWGSWHRVNGDTWLLGALVWPFFVGLFHLQSFLALLWDERRVKFDSEIEEQLWRMVHRRSGMQPLEFKHVMKLGRWRRYKAGDIIFDTEGKSASEAMCLHMMVEGLAFMSVRHAGSLVQRYMRSGYIFDLAVLNMFGVYLGLERSTIESVVAETDVILVKWDSKAVEKMASGSYPAVAAAWRNLALYNLGSAFSQSCGDIYASSGRDESEDFLQGGRSRDMIESIEEDEDGDRSTWFGRIWKFLCMHYPIAPPGIRHLSMPTSGMLARGRLLALQTSDKSTRAGEMTSRISRYESGRLDLDQAKLNIDMYP